MSTFRPLPQSPSLSALICFESAARHESFTAAAEELGLTQSAVSKTIRELESSLGIQLFRRVGRGIKLSAVGRDYARDTAQNLHQLEHARRRAVLSGQGKQLLKIATLPTFTNLWLVPRLPEFLTAHPEIELEFSTRLIPFDLGADTFDLAFHYGDQNWPETQMTRLFGEEMVPVCTPDFYAKHQLTTPESLHHVRLLHMASRPRAWADWFAKSGIEALPAAPGLTFDQYAMIINAALSGAGAAIVPLRMVTPELNSQRLTRLGSHSLATDAAYYIVHPAGPLSQTARAFVDWVKGVAPKQNQME
ncbi:LysR substrate-binding domain-containing protein [Tritonibacter mobilis]|uniref:LysR substrate-binding domain-containing protein n=1 Tax=Tritonibacter mobilis TaxID=379347 RepID=UPI000806AC80|nr:LysR substrate-binding domain-containing protein [Tritonibacter mobilis]